MDFVVPAKMSVIKGRLRALELWADNGSRPVFGWAPIMGGWYIVKQDDPPSVSINGIPWDGKPVPFGQSPFSEAACRYGA